MPSNLHAGQVWVGGVRIPFRTFWWIHRSTRFLHNIFLLRKAISNWYLVSTNAHNYYLRKLRVSDIRTLDSDERQKFEGMAIYHTFLIKVLFKPTIILYIVVSKVYFPKRSSNIANRVRVLSLMIQSYQSFPLSPNWTRIWAVLLSIWRVVLYGT